MTITGTRHAALIILASCAASAAHAQTGRPQNGECVMLDQPAVFDIIVASSSNLISHRPKGEHSMATTTRQSTKTINMPSAINESAPKESVPERVTQRKPADGRFRLQVDRQTKGSYATYESAEKVGLVIKKEHPIVQVAVYDGFESVNKIIELP